MDSLGRLVCLTAPHEVWAKFRECEPLMAGLQIDETKLSISPLPEKYTVRFEDGKNHARLTYHPEYSHANPWVSYINGAAGMHFQSMEKGAEYLKNKGFTQAVENKTSRPRI